MLNPFRLKPSGLKLAILLFLLLIASAARVRCQYRVAAGPPVQPQAPSGSPKKLGCPWLTEGTAARVLGGEVSATVELTGTLEGSCRFARPEPGSPDFLEVRVSKAVLRACPEQSPEVKGIGNWAIRCSPPGARGVQILSSRVRDLYFTVTLKVLAQKGDAQNDALLKVAEQIAGNLY